MEIKQGVSSIFIGDNEEQPNAIIEYVIKNNLYYVNHTYVSEELRGQGIAKKLLDTLVAKVREKGFKIVPICSYVKKEFLKNSIYDDIKDEGCEEDGINENCRIYR